MDRTILGSPFALLVLAQAVIAAAVGVRLVAGAISWDAVAEGVALECCFLPVGAALAVVVGRTWVLRLTQDGLRTRLTKLDRIRYEDIREVTVRGPTTLQLSLVSGETVALRVRDADAASAAIQARLAPINYRQP